MSDLKSRLIDFRKKKQCGSQRISSYLLYKKVTLSPMTACRILSKHQVKPIARRHKKADYIRYNKAIPCERVQLDATKLRNKAYQFTTIDDCTRINVIWIYPNKKAESTIHFLGEMHDMLQFPIQHI